MYLGQNSHFKFITDANIFKLLHTSDSVLTKLYYIIFDYNGTCWKENHFLPHKFLFQIP
jgi:hypothetical protein